MNTPARRGNLAARAFGAFFGGLAISAVLMMMTGWLAALAWPRWLVQLHETRPLLALLLGDVAQLFVPIALVAFVLGRVLFRLGRRTGRLEWAASSAAWALMLLGGNHLSFLFGGGEPARMWLDVLTAAKFWIVLMLVPAAFGFAAWQQSRRGLRELDADAQALPRRLRAARSRVAAPRPRGPTMNALLRLLAPALAAATLLAPAPTLAQGATPAAPTAAPAQKRPQFLYVLRLTPRLHDDAAWTDADKAAVGRHFRQLQAATAAGQVILAGRTMEPGERTFGLVIFEADDEAAARAFMASDPAVVAGVMTATLHPYAVALQRK